MALLLSNRQRRALGLVPAPQRQLVAPAPRRRRRANRSSTALVLARTGLQQPVGQQRPQGLIVPPRQRNRGVRRRAGAQLSLGTVPSAFSTRLSGGRPIYNGRREMVVSNSEVLATLNGTNGFSGNRWAVVPQAFTWLDGIASCFSRYRWLDVRFEFITASPTSQGGSIAMGAGYDVADQQPNSLQEVAAMSHGVLEQVWSGAGGGLEVVFDCSKWNQSFYSYVKIPDAGVPNKEIRGYQAYIPGFLYFGRDTQVNGQTIGQIRAHYTICLEDPIPARLNTESAAVGSVKVVERWGVDDASRQHPPTFEEVGLSLAERIAETSDVVDSLVRVVERLALPAPADDDDDHDERHERVPVTVVAKKAHVMPSGPKK